MTRICVCVCVLVTNGKIYQEQDRDNCVWLAIWQFQFSISIPTPNKRSWFFCTACNCSKNGPDQRPVWHSTTTAFKALNLLQLDKIENISKSRLVALPLYPVPIHFSLLSSTISVSKTFDIWPRSELKPSYIFHDALFSAHFVPFAFWSRSSWEFFSLATRRGRCRRQRELNQKQTSRQGKTCLPRIHKLYWSNWQKMRRMVEKEKKGTDAAAVGEWRAQQLCTGIFADATNINSRSRSSSISSCM